MAAIDNYNRLVGFDFLRGVAALGIVGCHLMLSPRTQSATLITGLCDMNVGLFAALSGYVMAYGHWDGWGAYAIKRAQRILPVYVTWTVVYLVLSATYQVLDGGVVNARYGNLCWWLRVVFWGSAAAHLWFLAALFYAQVAMAGLFRKVPGAVWIWCSLCIVSTSIWSKNWYVIYPIRLLAFLMLGRGLASIYGVWMKRFRWQLLVVGLFGMGLHFIPISCQTGFVRDWLSVVPILLAFVAWSDWFGGRLAGIGAFFGATSMGVYLIHPIFTKGVGIAVRHIFSVPYGVVPVVADWCVSWLCALIVSVVLLRSVKLSWLVR